MKISDTLWEAANLYLDHGLVDFQLSGVNRYSCCAVDMAESKNKVPNTPGCDFLASLGVKQFAGNQFDEFEYGEERQGARYLWLDFARLVALDEGL